MMPVIFNTKEKQIPLTYKKSSRAKRLSLRFSQREKVLVVTLPPRATSSQVKAFLSRCEPWVERQLKTASESLSIQPGENVSLYGTIFECTLDPLRRKPALCRVTQTLRLPPKCTQEDVYDVLKKLAAETLKPILEKMAQILGERLEKITLRDTKTRWGSCSGRKTISLNWRLILAPPEVAYYVCAHEAAHLLHMNHSKAFWKVVEDLCPPYKVHRQWLKQNGPRLMGV
jgi:predicted metal-dependent hydrolase